jgi:hypothetical protein
MPPDDIASHPANRALDEGHWAAMNAPATSSPDLDEALARAVDVARAAAREEAGKKVGAHLGIESDGEHVATHFFESTDPGYVGWRWAVTVVHVPNTTDVTVDEVVLLPGEGSLLPPPWVPWQERLRPGDLGVGDILPTTADDDRLVPSYADTDDDLDAEEVVVEFGLGRVRVLSRIGRDDAVDRWYAGAAGPTAPVAKAAPATCGTCGFWMPVAGALHGFFGACANEFAPDDGRVVSADHGCGGHSEALVISAEETPPAATGVIDDYEVVALAEPEPATEEFGHS